MQSIYFWKSKLNALFWQEKLRADLRKYSGRRKRKLTYLPCTSCSMAIWVWEIVARLWIAIVVINICRGLKNEKNVKIVNEMVFCYQNCSDLLWEKIDLVIEKNFWNRRLKAKNLQKFWDHYNNLFQLCSEKSEQFLVTEYFFDLFQEDSDQID